VISLGIDAGSTTIKIIGIDENKNIVFEKIENTEPEVDKQVERLLKDIDLSKITVVATGYGSNLIKFADKKVTEITCHAVGAFNYFNRGGTLIDIGGQDSKVVIISNKGKVLDFTMNDKCAAGTGRFLENIAWRLKIPVEKMGEIAINSNSEVKISSTCAVFAESEVISMLSKGEKLEAVIKGLHRALAKRIGAMANSLNIYPPLILSGGVAKNRAIQKMLQDELGFEVLIPENPQIIGAYGAAILGLNKNNIDKI